MALAPSRDYSALMNFLLFDRLRSTPGAKRYVWQQQLSGKARSRSGRCSGHVPRGFDEGNGPKYQVSQGRHEERRIADGRHHPEYFDAELHGFFPGFDIDFVERLDMLGYKGNGHNEHFLDAPGAKPFDGSGKRWLEPLGRSNPALVAQQVRFRPAGKLLSSLFRDQADRGFDLMRIGIPLLDQAHRQAMRAENQVNAGTVRELPEDGADTLRHRLNIKWMIVKLADGALRRAGLRLTIDTTPFFETAQRRRIRKMRVQGQKNDLIQRSSFAERFDGLGRERMPITHRHHGDRIDVVGQRLDERDSLPLRQGSNR